MSETTKKILITAIGAPNKTTGYTPMQWQINDRHIAGALPFMLTAVENEVDFILILGTEKSFDPACKHFEQLQEALKQYNFVEKHELLPISELHSRDTFWNDFRRITDHPSLKNSPVALYVDLTFGYRIQPMLIFLAAYFLNEMNPDITLKGVYYGMDKADPPRILDMTGLVDLLQWMKGAQMFVEGGSARILFEKIKHISGDQFGGVARNFQEFIDAYAFNYVADLPEKASEFQKVYRAKDFRRQVRNRFPVFALIHPYLLNFVSLFSEVDDLKMQLGATRRNFEDGAYSRAVIILRETFITFMMKMLQLKKNNERMKVERFIINRVYWQQASDSDKTPLSEPDSRKAAEIYKLLTTVFDKQLVDTFFQEWGLIRDMRNNAGHIRQRRTGSQKKEKNKDSDLTKFESLKSELAQHIKTAEHLFGSMCEKLPLPDEKITIIKSYLENNHQNVLFVIINEGMHPILPKLRKQYGRNINYKVLTTGNVALHAEKELAEKAHELARKNHNMSFYLIPGGLPYMAQVVYNVLQQTLSRHPVWLQYDRDKKKYVEKNLDPRKLLF